MVPNKQPAPYKPKSPSTPVYKPVPVGTPAHQVSPRPSYVSPATPKE